MPSDKQMDSISHTISRTLSGYFNNSKYEQRLRETLKEVDKLESRFDESIQQEVRTLPTTCLSLSLAEQSVSLVLFSSWTR